MDVTIVSSELIIGGCPRLPADIDSLVASISIAAVVSLQTDDDLRALGIDLGPLTTRYEALGIPFHRAPIREFDEADLRRQLPSCAHTLARAFRHGGPVYLHCTEGAGRAPTVAIADLHWRLGWPLDDARAHVAHLRTCAPKIDAIRLATRDLLASHRVRRQVERRLHAHPPDASPGGTPSPSALEEAERRVLMELFREAA